MTALGPVWVVKLGGSLAKCVHLRAWLNVLAQCGRPLVVVPGGGPFADAVRLAQLQIGYDDDAAHAMALLAMAQFGHALASLERRAVLVTDAAAITTALRQDELPIWIPTALVGDADAVRPCWDVTSDSLAAWLAGQIGAQGVLLVKSAQPTVLALADLTGQGMVDPAFEGYLRAAGVTACLAGPQDLPSALAVFQAGGIPGRQIRLSRPGDLA